MPSNKKVMVRPKIENPRHPDKGYTISGERTVTMDKGLHRMIQHGEIEVVETKQKKKSNGGKK